MSKKTARQKDRSTKRRNLPSLGSPISKAKADENREPIRRNKKGSENGFDGINVKIRTSFFICLANGLKKVIL